MSGGGWVCFGAGNLLAKKGKAHLVKANFVLTGMLMDETQHTPKEELAPYEDAAQLTSIYKLLATDFDNQQNDDQLYPGRLSESLLKKVPPFAVWTSEFDFYLRDNKKIAEMGKKHGKLLDISIMPGVVHGY